MKKIFSLISLLAAVIVFTACSSDNNYTTSDNYILEVVQAETTFGPDASTGQIVVNSDQSVVAVSSEDWCTVSVQGNIINVSVPDYDEIASRNALVTIVSGSRTIDVPVHQEGVVLAINMGGESSLTVGDEAVVKKLPYKSNADIKFSTDADWLSVNLNNGNMEVNISANETGHMRNTYIYYEKGEMKDSIKVVQCDFDKDILNKIFYFAGYDLSEEEDVIIAELAAFTKTEAGEYVLNFFQYDWLVPVTLASATEARISLSNNIGVFDPYTIGFVGWDLDQGYISWDSSVSISANFYYDEESESTMADIEDNGSWSGYVISGIRFEAWNAAGTRLGSLESIGWPFLQEYTEASGSRRAFKNKTFKLNTAPVKSL